MLDTALWYVALGWHVFPCRPGAKRPATLEGCRAARTDPEQIREWWQQHPAMNVAVATGPSGLLVVDIDCKAVDGFANWCALGSQHGPWIDTLTVVTPSGGFHWYFTVDPELRIGNSTGKLAEGIDTRGRGGYVLAPPSRLENGVYEIDDDHPVAPAPGWLLELLREPVWSPAPTTHVKQPDKYAAAAMNGVVVELTKARLGERNNKLFTSARRLGQFVATGDLDMNEVAARLADTAALIGLDQHEAERTIASGMRWGLSKPRERVS